MRNDRDVMLAAVKNNCDALQIASRLLTKIGKLCMLQSSNIHIHLDLHLMN